MAESNGGVPFFGDKSLMLGVAFVASLVAFVIIALGVEEADWLWILGFVLLVAGLALAPLARFTAGGSGDDEDEGDEEASGEGEGDEADDGDEGHAGEEEAHEGREGRGDERRRGHDERGDDEGRGARRV
jgi:hypothetical protein